MSESIRNWEAPTSTGNHFAVLDGIRGVAILMVVIFHAFYTNPDAGRLSQTAGLLIGGGVMGVPIFFVLSGFLISYPFFRQKVRNPHLWWIPGYATRRAGKILPPYFLALIIFTVYYCVRFSDTAYIKSAAQWALGLPNFIRSDGVGFQVPFWSLVVEMHFYLLTPVLFFLLRRLTARHSAVLLFLAFLAIPLIVRQLTWPDHAPSLLNIQFSIVRFPCQMDYFCWGILFSFIFMSVFPLRDELRSLSILGYAGAILVITNLCMYALWTNAYNIPAHPTRWSVETLHLMSGFSAFLLLFLVFDPTCLATRILSHPALRFVGIVSYEWYLFHQPVVHLFQETIGQTHGSFTVYILKTVTPLALTFGFSVLVYHNFSLPLLNRIRGVKSHHAK
ncbi:MAG: acyltransferase [Chthoniobacterales bacterium]